MHFYIILYIFLFFKDFENTASTQFFNANMFRAQTSTPIRNSMQTGNVHQVANRQQIHNDSLPTGKYLYIIIYYHISLMLAYVLFDAAR